MAAVAAEATLELAAVVVTVDAIVPVVRAPALVWDLVFVVVVEMIFVAARSP